MTIQINNKYDFSKPNNHESASGFQRLKELIIINLFGGIPRPIGTMLRKLIYPYIFHSVGENLYIQKEVELLGADSIEVGDNVKILRDVRLNAKYANSRLRLGNNVCLEKGVDIHIAGDDCLIEIGDESFLGPYVCMAGPGNIKIGKQVLIASHTGIYANNHREYELSREGIVIEDNCWLGSGVRVLDGVTIKKGCVIGAGAVVTKDIPAFSVAVGVPAKVIKASKGGVV